MPGKLGQHRFVGVFFAGRVLVHPQNAGAGQKFRQFFLNTLGAEAAALGAERRQRMHRLAAVVAHQRLLGFVVDQRHTAVGAFQHVAAIGAHADGAVAPAI